METRRDASGPFQLPPEPTFTSKLPPIIASQGGIPYNNAHLKAKDAEIATLRDEIARLKERLGVTTALRDAFSKDKAEERAARLAAEGALGGLAPAYGTAYERMVAAEAELARVERARDELIAAVHAIDRADDVVMERGIDCIEDGPCVYTNTPAMWDAVHGLDDAIERAVDLARALASPGGTTGEEGTS